MKVISAAAILLTGAASFAHAQNYPDRPIRLIVPYPPGSSTNDILGRALASRLTGVLGQQVVVDNRSGASGNVGSELVAKSAPDGYTLLIGVAGPLAVGPAVYKNLGYVPTRDLAPIAMYAAIPYIFVVNPSLPANNVKELIALAKSKPGQLNFASSGSGGSPHLCGELFKVMAGIDIVHIPYKGGGAAITDLLAGQVSMYFGTTPSTLPFVQNGKLRALGVTTAKRTSAAPDVPTIAEAGLPGYEQSAWHGLLAPAGTPEPVIAKLHAEMSKVVRSRDVLDKFAAQGIEVIGGSSAEFAAFIRGDVAKYAKLMKTAGIKLD